MIRKALLAATAAAAVGAIAAPAHADNIGLGVWYAFDFQGTGSPLLGGGSPGTSPAGVSAPTAPWTITLSTPSRLLVTDVEISGDRFEIFDNGVSIGLTSAPVVDFNRNVGECISCALAISDYSRGVFILPAGVNVLSGTQLGVINFGDGDFIIKSGIPEPATWSLMLVGFGGLGAALRSRRKTAIA